MNKFSSLLIGLLVVSTALAESIRDPLLNTASNVDVCSEIQSMATSRFISKLDAELRYKRWRFLQHSPYWQQKLSKCAVGLKPMLLSFRSRIREGMVTPGFITIQHSQGDDLHLYERFTKREMATVHHSQAYGRATPIETGDKYQFEMRVLNEMSDIGSPYAFYEFQSASLVKPLYVVSCRNSKARIVVNREGAQIRVAWKEMGCLHSGSRYSIEAVIVSGKSRLISEWTRVEDITGVQNNTITMALPELPKTSEARTLLIIYKETFSAYGGLVFINQETMIEIDMSSF